MLAAAKYIGAGLAAIGLTGAGKIFFSSVAPSKDFFDKVHETDQGQDTDNVFIIASRFIASRQIPNARIINEVLKLYKSESLDSEVVASFEQLYKQRVTFDIPLDRKDMATLRSLSDDGKPSGVYIFTHRESVEQYVGSSKDLVDRVRGHYYGKSHGRLAQHIKAHEVTDYNVSIVVLAPSMVSKTNILALEQYLIFLLNPSINFLKVANSSHKQYSAGQVDKLREAMANKIFVYYKGVLVHIFYSNRQMYLSLGQSNGFGNHLFIRANGIYRVHLLFSKTEIESAPVDMMSFEDFLRLFNDLKDNGDLIQALPSNSHAVTTTHNGVKVQHQSMTALAKWLEEQTGKKCTRQTLTNTYLDSSRDYLGYKLERVYLDHPGYINARKSSKE